MTKFPCTTCLHRFRSQLSDECLCCGTAFHGHVYHQWVDVPAKETMHERISTLEALEKKKAGVKKVAIAKSQNRKMDRELTRKTR